MLYYLKKCGFQELGSVGIDGVVHRGRYMLTSMNNNVQSFFPPLTTAELNDSALLPIIPLYSGKKVYCNYVYHNDKFHGSRAKHPRNEHRIYLNNELEDNKLLFGTNDIVVMRQDEINEENIGTQTVYFMDLIKDHDSKLYHFCDQIIDEYPITGGYGIYEGVISEFETQVARIMSHGEPPVAIDTSVTRRVAAEEDTDSVADLFNANSFRDFVMVGYENKCAITGKVISYGNYSNLEAAHIKPKSHGGLFIPDNGIALNRDLHWAFDKGFFTLNDSLEVQVHPKVSSDYLQSFNGQSIRIPSNSFFVPNFNNIEYHRRIVFGLFLTSGRL